jgi:outer membrane protein TolC
MNNLFRLLFIGILLIGGQHLIYGQGGFPFRQDSALSLIRPDTLRLDEILAVINAHHPKLQEFMLGRKGADAALLRAWGNLDPSLDVELTGKQEKDKFKQQSAKAEVTVPLYWGPKISAGWKRTLGLFDQDINTPLDGEASVGISMPLWRNILIDKNRASIQKAEQMPALAEALIIEKRNELFLKGSQKFWDWAGAYQKLRIADQLLSIARFRAVGISEEVLRGERAQIDSVEMSQEIQRRTGSYIKARRDYEKAAISLGLFLWKPDGTPASIPPNIIPPSLPLPINLALEEYQKARDSALLRRPEINENLAEQKMADIEVSFASEQWKPDINLKFAPFSQQFGSSGSINRFDYKVGVQAEIPILQRNAFGQIAQAEVKQRSVELKRSLILREIGADVDDAASDVLASYEQALAATAEKNAALQMESAERQLFDQGESSLFTVNLRERFSAEAASREADALSGFQKALAKYRWAIAAY